jgi:hypothetical protein
MDGSTVGVEIRVRAGYSSVYRKTPGALASRSENLPLFVRFPFSTPAKSAHRLFLRADIFSPAQRIA